MGHSIILKIKERKKGCKHLGNTLEGLWCINMYDKAVRGDKICILVQNILATEYFFQIGNQCTCMTRIHPGKQHTRPGVLKDFGLKSSLHS